MSNFITGLFTLIAALSAVWLTYHLNNKKTNQLLIKEKAAEAYRLTSRLVRFLHIHEAICHNIITGKTDINIYLKEDQTELFDQLEKLQLLILQNFDNLIKEYKKCSDLTSNHLLYLINIQSNNVDREISIKEFNDACSSYKIDIAIATSCLQIKLERQFIRKKVSYPNLYRIIDELKVFINNFFKKD